MPPGALQIPARCRECGAEIALDELRCPQCDALRPARPSFSGEGFEWKTSATWLGAPLVHVAFGMDATGRPRRACGLLAIGQHATGAVAIGIVARGIVAVGAIAVGLGSAGIVAIGLLGAAGVNALGAWSYGVVAFGWTAHGLATFDWR